MSIQIEPLKPHIGAVVHVDRAALLDPGVAPRCIEALEERGVLVFPRLGLNDEEQLAFTDSLGDRLDFTSRSKFTSRVPGTDTAAPGVYTVTLDPKINNRPEYVLGTFFWHMDGMPVVDIPPPKASLLSARKISAKGGQTEFASTSAAYDALSDEEKAEIDGLRVIHSTYHAVQPTLLTAEEHDRSREASNERERPLVWAQGGTGRKSLIIGHTADRVVGMSVSEGRALLSRLMEWAAQPNFTYRHQWEEGDLVIWHNSGVLHRVRPYDTHSGRVMHRTSLAGTDAIA